jgi:hypothetical protein
MLSVHPSRKTALITPDLMQTKPTVPAKEYVDGFGNIGHVIHATAGMMTDGGWIIGQIAVRPATSSEDYSEHNLSDSFCTRIRINITRRYYGR